MSKKIIARVWFTRKMLCLALLGVSALGLLGGYCVDTVRAGNEPLSAARGLISQLGQWPWLSHLASRPNNLSSLNSAKVSAVVAAQLVVTSPGDTQVGAAGCADGCSLREAIEQANAQTGDDVIEFDPTVFAGTQTITLGGTQLLIANKSKVTINGTGATRLTISGNNASRVVYVEFESNLTLNGVTVTAGKLTGADNDGGGIYSRGSLTITDSTITGNFASGSNFNRGAGIFSTGALTITNSIISGNAASGGTSNIGGGINNFGGTVTVINSTISGNSASGGNDSNNIGGGIFNGANRPMTITNSTISGNSVSGGSDTRGGGVFNSGGLTITNVTLTGNSASGGSGDANQGGGLYSDKTWNARNTIISGNTAMHFADSFGSLSGASENNLIGDPNVRLAPLGFYGGLTLTHPLLSGSSAINAGNNCVLNQSCADFNAPATLPSDQRGAARVGQVDIGAFEVNDTYRAQLPNGNQNVAYNYTLIPNRGSFTYSVTGGALPNGITLATNGDIVALTGTTAQTGGFNFSVTATDGMNTFVTDYALTIVQPNIAPPPDTTPPDTHLGSTPPAPSNSGDATFAFNGTDNIGVTGFECSLDGADFAACSSPQSYMDLGEGQHIFAVRAQDAAGNVDPSPASFAWTIDQTAPRVTLSTDPASSPSAPFTVTANFEEPVTGFTLADITVSNGTASDLTGSGSSYSFTVTPSAPNTVRVSVPANAAQDAAGNQNTASNELVVSSNGPLMLVVTKTADTDDGMCDADCSLREAIAAANSNAGNDVISFDPTVFAGTKTITLMQGQLAIANNGALTINGTGAARLAISGNQASNVFFVDSEANLTLNGVTVTAGKAPLTEGNLGGGIINAGTLTITNSTISGNSASGEFFNGGGGIASNGTLTIINSTISGNTVSGGFFNIGGGIMSAGTLTITNSTISGNTVSGGSFNGGGGIGNFGGTLTIANSTISGNTVSGNDNIGGGIVSGGTLTITNSTITANSASSGGGIADSSETPLNVRNTIISGNTATSDPDLQGSLSATSENNLIGDPNVRLAPLGNYGSPTQTHALLPGSSAINAGNNCVLNQSCADFNAPVAVTTDQRGVARPQQTTVDIGAFESQGFTLAINGGNNQSAAPGANFANPLSVTVTALGANEPVDGGVVTFTPPATGASASVAGNPVTITNGVATTGTVTANNMLSSYNVAASANGANAVNFSLNNTNQVPPTITAQAGLSRPQDSTATVQIATASDANQAANTLSISVSSNGVNFSNTATVNGVTITLVDGNGNAAGNNPNAQGAVFAQIAAACGATNASFTLSVTDNDAVAVTTPLAVTVTVEATAPVIACNNVAAQTASVNANCQAAVPDVTTLVRAQSSDTCTTRANLIITQSPAAGTLVGLGSNPITVTVKDAANNSAMYTVAFTVSDVTAPTLICPSNQVGVTSNSAPNNPVPVSWTTQVNDNCAGVSSACNPPSGSLFPVGVTTVTCTASDGAGNTAMCSFTVTVRQSRSAVRDMITKVKALAPGTLTTAQANQLVGHLELANSNLERGQTAAACTNLQNFVNQVNALRPPLSTAQAQDLLSYANKIRNAVGCAGGPF